MHAVKCDGELFHIPGGYLREVLVSHSCYENVDYRALKDAVNDGRLNPGLSRLSNFRSGYLDFDLMEQRGNAELPALGHYIHVIDGGPYRNSRVAGIFTIIEEKTPVEY
ncbi:hypothetical protein HY501_02785 [Candidatus Woesearchaeota archaeon]|nr:hypothetical protein [Candidatus Woesearchaeota archaeon]